MTMSTNIGCVFIFAVYWLCSVGYVKVFASLQCYSCPSETTAEGCQTVSSCGPDEVCMLKRTVDNNTQAILYESRCEGKLACDKELDRYKAILTALVGRKREMKQVLADDVCLIQCCDNDLCNNGCIMPTNPSVSEITTQSATTNKQALTETVSTNMQQPFVPTLKIPQHPIHTNTKQPALTTTAPVIILVPTKPPSKVTTVATKMTTSLHTVSTTPSGNINTISHTGNTNKFSTPSTDINTIVFENSQTSMKTSKSYTILAPTTTTYTSSVSSTSSGFTTRPSTLLESLSTSHFQSTRIQNFSTENEHSIQTSTASKTTVQTSVGHQDSTTKSISKQDCPYGSLTFDTSCYIFGRREMSYSDAKMFCAKLNSHLVHVDSSRENEFLKSQLRKMHNGPLQYWIGITDTETENVWKFYDSGKEATFYDWSPGEPDGTQLFDGNADADCAVFDPFLNFQWRDEDCSPYQSSEPVCEISTA